MAELLDRPTCFGECAWVEIDVGRERLFVLAVRSPGCSVHGVITGPWLPDDRSRTSPYVAVAVVEAGR